MRVFSVIASVLLASPAWLQAEPAYVCRTKNRVVVIEPTGSDKYRYSTWNNKQAMSDKPELVLNGGSSEIQGTGPCASRYWIFKSGAYTYSVSDSVACGPGGTPDNAVGDLTVAKNNEVLSISWCLKGSPK